MLTRRLDWLGAGDHAALVRNGRRGIERETLRTAQDGTLSQRPHPKAFGSALTHPGITTDYSEALLELVTTPEDSNWATLQQLCDLHIFVQQRLDGELLWPMSMPCRLGSDEAIPIASYGTSNLGMLRTIYRRGLGYRYGRAMQAIAGVHFNYSPPAELWRALQLLDPGAADDAGAFKSAALMGLSRNYRRHAWLVIYLFGASPAFAKSFLPQGSPLVESLDADTWYAGYATSLRMSDLGYQNKNQARLEITLNSLAEYVDGLERAMRTPEPRYARIGVRVDGEYRQLSANVLQIENEYYSTIRPKPRKTARRTAVGLREEGVEYVEVRTLDSNPADPVGINQQQLRFLEVLILHCLLADSPAIQASEQREIDERNLTIAREGRRPGLLVQALGERMTLAKLGARLAPELRAVAALLDGAGRDYGSSVDLQLAALEDPSLTPSARLLDSLRGTSCSFEQYGLEIARRHQEYFESLELGAARTEVLSRQTAQSAAAQLALESDKSLSFEEFLSHYLR